MICRTNCPRGLKKTPIANVVADDDSSFVCICYHDDKKEYPQDVFRHCFKSAADTDTMLDYDEYDLKSVINVMTEALLISELNGL